MNRKENMILKLIKPLNGSFDIVRLFIDNGILNVDDLIPLVVSYKCFAFAKYLLSDSSLMDLDSGDYLCNSIFEQCRLYICYLDDLCGIVKTAVENERIKKSTLCKFEKSVAEKVAQEANTGIKRYYLQYFLNLPGASREWFMDPFIDKISVAGFIELCIDGFPLTASDNQRMADHLVKNNDINGMISCSYYNEIVFERSTEYMIGLRSIEHMTDFLFIADRRYDYVRIAQLSFAIIELATEQNDYWYFDPVQRILNNNFYGREDRDPTLSMVQEKLEDAVVGSHSADAIVNYISYFGVNERVLAALIGCGEQEKINVVKNRYPNLRDGIDRATATLREQRITCGIVGEMTGEQKISTLLYLAETGDSSTIEACLPAFADLFIGEKKADDKEEPKTYQKLGTVGTSQKSPVIEDGTG